MSLTSARIPVADEQAARELFVRNGWGDGLPVVAPTPERVARFVAASGLAPGKVIGALPEQGRTLTCEKIAVNAVAAGCREEYMAVLLAAVRALTREEKRRSTRATTGRWSRARSSPRSPTRWCPPTSPAAACSW